MKMKDEKAFTDSFLALSTDMELALLQHDLRKFPEDAPYLKQVLGELAKRAKAAPAPPQSVDAVDPADGVVTE